MQKVKVQRYISGKRPEYAQYKSSDEDSEIDDFIDRRQQRNFANRGDESFDLSRKRDDTLDTQNDEVFDPRLRRLAARNMQSDSDSGDNIEEEDREKRLRRYHERRHIQEPEIIESDQEQNASENESEKEEKAEQTMDERKRRIELDDSGSDDSELSDCQIEKRRQRLKNKILLQKERKNEEVMEKVEEEQFEEESSEEESSEDEEEEEIMEIRKPMFVSKKDRATIAEKEKEAQKQRQLEYEAKRLAKERRRQTLRMVEDSVKKDLDKLKVQMRL